jgi:hypothetical protein
LHLPISKSYRRTVSVGCVPFASLSIGLDFPTLRHKSVLFFEKKARLAHNDVGCGYDKDIVSYIIPSSDFVRRNYMAQKHRDTMQVQRTGLESRARYTILFRETTRNPYD